MNRSAKDGTRSSPHYGGEGVSIHPSNQGVCERHGTEERCVTPGDLDVSAGSTAETNPISARRDARRGVGRSNSTSSAVKAARPSNRQSSGLGKATDEVVEVELQQE